MEPPISQLFHPSQTLHQLFCDSKNGSQHWWSVGLFLSHVSGSVLAGCVTIDPQFTQKYVLYFFFCTISQGQSQSLGWKLSKYRRTMEKKTTQKIAQSNPVNIPCFDLDWNFEGLGVAHTAPAKCPLFVSRPRRFLQSCRHHCLTRPCSVVCSNRVSLASCSAEDVKSQWEPCDFEPCSHVSKDFLVPKSNASPLKRYKAVPQTLCLWVYQPHQSMLMSLPCAIDNPIVTKSH